MTDRSDPLGLRRFPITFEKGVLQSLEDSAVPNGYAPRIENWVPTPAGGLRVRQGWINAGTSKNIVGMRLHGELAQVFAIHSTSTGFSVYSTGGASPGGVLTLVGSKVTPQPTQVAMAMGAHTLAFGSPSFTKLYGIDNTGAIVDSGTNAVPQGVRTLVYHDDAFWAGGGNDLSGSSHPARLFFTDPGDGALGSWPANNWIDVGLAAGGQINALGSHRGDLLIGKSNGLWLLQGTPEDALDLHALDQGNAVLGDSIMSTPYGAVVCGYDSVYLFDGSSVHRISGPIEGVYKTGVGALDSYNVDAVFLNNRLYVCSGGDTHVHVFDFVTGSWSTEAFSSEAESPYRLTAMQDPALGIQYLTAGTYGAATAKGLIYKQLTVPPTYSNDFTTEAFALRTPEYWLGGPVQRATVRYLDLTLRQRGTTGSGLTITPTTDGVAGTGAAIKTVAPNAAAGSFRTRLDFRKNGLTGFGFQFLVTQAAASTHAIFDIESAVILYELEGAQA